MDMGKYLFLPEGKVYTIVGRWKPQGNTLGCMEIFAPSSPEKQYKDIPYIAYWEADETTHGEPKDFEESYKTAVSVIERKRAIWYFNKLIEAQEELKRTKGKGSHGKRSKERG